MATGALPTPLRRVIALVLVALVLAAAALVALAPFARTATLNEQIAAVTDLIAQQERLLRRTAIRPARVAKEVMLAGESSGLAGAELQRLISELARQNDMSLRSTNLAAPKREADFTVIAVDASLNGRMEGLRSFLHAVETGAPILFIEALSVRSLPATQSGEQPVALDVTLKVRGYGQGKANN
jgi:general secretion pathway protein M